MYITPVMTKRKRSEHYVNNKEFLAALIEYSRQIKIAEEQGNPKPRITNYIGDCFLKIATHLSYKTNFINYMYLDEMISDGIQDCVQRIHNFNHEKYDNPFAYFTQIIYFAFLRRIAKEKKQMEIRSRIIEKNGYSDIFVDDNISDGSNYSDYNSIKDAIHTKLRY
jgi:hypothetical protein